MMPKKKPTPSARSAVNGGRIKPAVKKAKRSRDPFLVPPIHTGAGDSLLIGWRTEEPPPRIGFHSGETEDGQAKDNGIWLAGEGHLITIAPTGAGKGRGALIPNLLMYEGPAIVIDPKGEACHVTARRRCEMGQEVFILDPFGIVTDKTDSLNPLDAFSMPGVEHSSLAMDIAKQLSGGVTSLKDRFWDIRGHDLSAGVISAVASTCEGEDRTLKKVRNYMKSDDVTYNLAVLLDTVGSKLHRFAYEEISSVLQITEVTRSGIIATASAYFSVIASDAAQKTILNSTIDLKAVARGDPMTIYLVVPPSKLASHAPLFRLWTSALMAAVLSRESDLPEYRTLFAIDECAQLGDFEQLAMVYTLARSYGVRVWSFFQDLAQLKRILPLEWQTVLANAAGLQVFGVPNHQMASDMAAVLGDFSEEALRRLDPADLVLQLTGQRGMIARRPDYLLDPQFAGHFDAHPLLAKKAVKRAGRKEEEDKHGRGG
jgi:type IV secretion system protein VirD4